MGVIHHLPRLPICEFLHSVLSFWVSFASELRVLSFFSRKAHPTRLFHHLVWVLQGPFHLRFGTFNWIQVCEEFAEIADLFFISKIGEIAVRLHLVWASHFHQGANYKLPKLDQLSLPSMSMALCARHKSSVTPLCRLITFLILVARSKP